VPRVPSIPTPGTIAPGGQSATGLISGT
jgi:hypothetical protein